MPRLADVAYRRFADAEGRRWEIVVRGREWLFEPIEDNPGPRRSAQAPGYEKDPFELSVEELQKMLGAAAPARSASSKSPFND